MPDATLTELLPEKSRRSHCYQLYPFEMAELRHQGERMAMVEDEDRTSHARNAAARKASLSSMPTVETSTSTAVRCDGSNGSSIETNENDAAPYDDGDYSDDESLDVDSFGQESAYSSSHESSSYGMSTAYNTKSTGGSSTLSGEDWSSDEDDSEYDDLMAEMPIALGRQGPACPSRGRPMSLPPKTAPLPIPVMPSQPEGLPAMTMGENPLEDLAMFNNIRAELQKVGQLIVEKKDGAKFLQRAHILASINWLSANVPSCVLEHLGHEIRDRYQALDESEAMEEDPIVTPLETTGQGLVGSVNIIPDDSSEASELSEGHVPRAESPTNAEEEEESEHFIFEDPYSALHIPRPEVTVSWNPLDMQESSHAETHDRSHMRSNSVDDTHEHSDHESLLRNPLPCVEYFQCALLFVDISGFTRLSTILDPENLSKVINSYFQKIVDKIFEFQGDIQKFAGDALFAEWRVSDTMNLDQCVEAAAACSASLVSECADYPVMAFGDLMFGADESSPISTLNVHCGLGCGEMAGIHVGDSADRREYLYLGDPIVQAGDACDKASLGQCMASDRFSYILKRYGGNNGAFPKEPNLIVSQGTACINPTRFLENNENRVKHHKSRGVTDHVEGLDVDALIEYRRLMSLYVHPVVVSNDVAANDDFKSSKAANHSSERHREEAELRSAYVMFINPLIPINLTGNDDTDMEAVELMNDIMNLVTRELKRYSGHLRQFIVDDKGVVLIATFGLRGSTFPNLVAERALPATIVIHNALQMELDVRNKIGATFGDVYCGAVGGETRHEYACMGPSVNLAARLMASKDNPGILVDHHVRKLASRTYAFNALSPVKAKGYADLVPIFEPLSPLDRTWGRVDPNFVGRMDEIQKMINIAKDMASMKHVVPKIVMVSGSSGTGKSAIIVQAIEHIGRMMRPLRSKKFLVAKHVGKEQDSLIPFATIKQIVAKVLAGFRKSRDDMTYVSSHSCGTRRSMISGASNSTGLPVAKQADILDDVFEELDADETVQEYITHILLESNNDYPSDKIPSQSEIVNTLARVFTKCVEEARLTILALDDAHQADEMSWEVLRQIFRTANNVIIIGTTYSTHSCTIRVREQFWEELNTIHLRNGRYVDLQLDALTKDEVKLMTMKSLGIQEADVTPSLLNEVWTQSGGMPHFASEILMNIKIRQGITASPGKNNDAIAEIILHRIDSFDVAVRNALNAGAVMGMSFTLADVLAATKDYTALESRASEDRRQTMEALEMAVHEGILHVDEMIDGDFGDDTVFTFFHSVWQSTLLGLMLQSRKRDVHRHIAMDIENRLEQGEDLSTDVKKKMFLHWKGAGDTEKSSQAALLVGRELESEHHDPKESIRIYQETLQMWRWSKTGGVGGFNPQVMQVLGADHLSSILRVTVAMGRAFGLDGRPREEVAVYENALNILETAAKAGDIRDRSVIFPAFTGLCQAIADGHIAQDVYCRYEMALLRRYLQETRRHGRLIHHIHGLYLQFNLYSRLNELEKAIAVQSVIKNLYKADKHSAGLRKFYGQDSAVVAYARSAHWQLIQGSNKTALRGCRTILKEFIPKVETDIAQSFNVIYPLILVLKETGYANEAIGFFEKVIVGPYGASFAKGGAYDVLRMREGLTILLELCGKKAVSDEKIEEYIQWTSDPERLCFGSKINRLTGRLGRCADSLSIELCGLLARRTSNRNTKSRLLSSGNFVANQAVIFNRKQGFKVAQAKAYALMTELRSLEKS